jgi:hypothetical protein
MKTPALAIAALVISATSALAQSPTVEDRLAMIDAVTSIAAGADRHDWARVRSAFADEVTLDYTSLWGGTPATQTAEDIVAQWAGFLPGFDETLHLVTNHTIAGFYGDAATLEADFQAAHRIGDRNWMLSGHYTYELARVDGAWKVDALTMTWTHESGDRSLVGQAAERAQSAN